MNKTDHSAKINDPCANTHNKHGFRGVEWSRSRQKYRAKICRWPGTKRGRWLGCFDNPADAALAYDEAAREIYGPVARLNFPQPTELAIQMSKKAKGWCLRGHEMRGRENCLICNATAARRYKARKAA